MLMIVCILINVLYIFILLDEALSSDMQEQSLLVLLKDLARFMIKVSLASFVHAFHMHRLLQYEQEILRRRLYNTLDVSALQQKRRNHQIATELVG